MNESIFERFNQMFDMDGLKGDVAKANTKGGDFVEVPHGDYEVKVVKLELGETGPQSKTPGMPMVKIWYEILVGEYAGQKIFQNQMLTSGFGIHKMNELLTSFATGLSVEFENFMQYGALLEQIFNEIDGKAEYQLAYTANRKNEKFSEYAIIQRYV